MVLSFVGGYKEEAVSTCIIRVIKWSKTASVHCCTYLKKLYYECNIPYNIQLVADENTQDVMVWLIQAYDYN
jgi:hypothetical protein